MTASGESSGSIRQLRDRLSEAVLGLLDAGCPAVVDPFTGGRCGRRRYDRRRCLRCAEIRAKPLDLIRAHAEEYGLSLRSAYLVGARLSGGQLRWVTMRFSDLTGADLSGADLRDTDLSDCDLSSADFRGADLTHARLRSLRGVAGARFEGAVLEDAILALEEGAGAKGVSFAAADLTGAKLSGTGLPGASFRGSRLAGADLTNSVFAGADFSGADLSGADLTGADLTGAAFGGACLDGTKLPAGKSAGLLGAAESPGPGLPRDILARCMRTFAASPASAIRTKLRVLARRAEDLRREEALDLILPILETTAAADEAAHEAVAAMRALGRDRSTRPFLVGLLTQGAPSVRLEAASILAEPPLEAETARLFRSILASPDEGRREFGLGIFRTLAPGIEDRDAESISLARALFLEDGLLFDGELVAALGQAGIDDEEYRRRVEEVAFGRGFPEQSRLAAARELTERFFDEETCERLAGLLESAEEPARFRRNVFWFLARHVASGEAAAVGLARRLLDAVEGQGREGAREIETDVRWALAESGDEDQLPHFLELVRRGAQLGWREASPAEPGLPSYDDLVRAAQLLGEKGADEAVEPLAALIRREQSGAGAPAASFISLVDAAREAILEIRGRTEVLVPSGEETRIEELYPAGSAAEETRAEEVPLAGEETRVEPADPEEAVSVPADGAEAEEGPVGIPPEEVFGRTETEAEEERRAELARKLEGARRAELIRRAEEERRRREAEARRETAPAAAADERPPEKTKAPAGRARAKKKPRKPRKKPAGKPKRKRKKRAAKSRAKKKKR
jgi:uncharacterized protein YjbI with pentapeptide repeats